MHFKHFNKSEQHYLTDGDAGLSRFYSAEFAEAISYVWVHQEYLLLYSEKRYEIPLQPGCNFKYCWFIFFYEDLVHLFAKKIIAIYLLIQRE